jgi:hypothetical protein
MLLHSIHSEKLATLATQVSLADEATPELLSEIVAKTAQRMYQPGAAQLKQLIEAGRSGACIGQSGTAALANSPR